MKFPGRFEPAFLWLNVALFMFIAMSGFFRFGLSGVSALLGLVILSYLFCLPCHYTVESSRVICRCGIYVQRADLAEIVSVTSISSLAFGPKWSIVGLRLQLRSGKRIDIEPKDRPAFLRELLRQAPHIQLEPSLARLI